MQAKWCQVSLVSNGLMINGIDERSRFALVLHVFYGLYFTVALALPDYLVRCSAVEGILRHIRGVRAERSVQES